MDFFQKKIGCNSKPLINFKFINFCRNVGCNPGIKIISAGLFISAMCQSNSQPQLVNRDSVKCGCGRRMRMADGGWRTADGGRRTGQL